MSVTAPGHIPWTTVDLRLQATRSIWLSTTRPDGRPHCVPVWFVWRDNKAWFITDRRLQKARNLGGGGWVVLSAGDGDDVIIIEGPATVVADEAERADVDRLYSAKYVDPATGQTATVRDDDADLYRVTARHIMAWSYGAVGGRTDWRFGSGELESRRAPS